MDKFVGIKIIRIFQIPSCLDVLEGSFLVASGMIRATEMVVRNRFVVIVRSTFARVLEIVYSLGRIFLVPGYESQKLVCKVILAISSNCTKKSLGIIYIFPSWELAGIDGISRDYTGVVDRQQKPRWQAGSGDAPGDALRKRA